MRRRGGSGAAYLRQVDVCGAASFSDDTVVCASPARKKQGGCVASRNDVSQWVSFWTGHYFNGNKTPNAQRVNPKTVVRYQAFPSDRER
jgi:hypothetical protein